MYEKDIERFILEIAPRVIAPIHMEHLDLFTSWCERIWFPTLGKP